MPLFPEFRKGFLFLLILAGSSHAQEMAVPAEVQVRLIQGMVTFERTIAERNNSVLTVALVYQHAFRHSEISRNEIANAFAEVSQGEQKCVILSLNLDDERDLRRIVAKTKADILYIAPLRSFDVGTITAISRSMKILTVTGVPEYVENFGVAVGIGVSGERPVILINLKASKAEGANFSSRLLNIAKIIE